MRKTVKPHATKTANRRIYDSLDREQQLEVEKKYREQTGQSLSTFYAKLNSARIVRPYEEKILKELLTSVINQ